MITVIVEVMPKEGILDPQGKAVQNALHKLGFDAVAGVKVGKRVMLDIDSDDRDAALSQAEEMADKLLHNENVEGYRVMIAEGAEQ